VTDKQTNKLYMKSIEYLRYVGGTEVTEKRSEFIRIEEGDSFKLIVKEVTTDMAGKCMARISNELGSCESSAMFTVYSTFCSNIF
jgi:hypothetical protein